MFAYPWAPSTNQDKEEESSFCLQNPWDMCTKPLEAHTAVQRGYGATAARLTPDQKVGSSNLSGLICHTLPTMEPTTAKLPQQAAGCVPGLKGGTRPH